MGAREPFRVTIFGLPQVPGCLTPLRILHQFSLVKWTWAGTVVITQYLQISSRKTNRSGQNKSSELGRRRHLSNNNNKNTPRLCTHRSIARRRKHKNVGKASTPAVRTGGLAWPNCRRHAFGSRRQDGIKQHNLHVSLRTLIYAILQRPFKAELVCVTCVCVFFSYSRRFGRI